MLTKKISELLPQAYPFVFIDKILSIDIENKRIRCLKNVSGNESYLQGHFPGNPVMPGVLIVEAMAQASILMFNALKPAVAAGKPDYFLGKVEARFLHPVRPGDQLIIEATAEKIIDTGGIVKVTAVAGQATAAEAKIFFGVKNKNE